MKMNKIKLGHRSINSLITIIKERNGEDQRHQKKSFEPIKSSHIWLADGFLSIIDRRKRVCDQLISAQWIYWRERIRYWGMGRGRCGFIMVRYVWINGGQEMWHLVEKKRVLIVMVMVHTPPQLANRIMMRCIMHYHYHYPFFLPTKPKVNCTVFFFCILLHQKYQKLAILNLLCMWTT